MTLRGALRGLRTRRGATAVGYGLLVGLVGLAILGAVAATGDRLQALMGMTANELGEAIPPAPAAPPPPPPAPHLAWNPPAATGLDVAASGIPSYSAATALSLVNSGNAPATGIAPTVGSGFQIVSTECATTLAAGESCPVTVRSSATANGALSGSLSAGGDGPSATLSGTASGFDGALAVAAEALAVAPVTGAAGAPGACTPLAVENTGWGAIAGLAIAIAGGDASAFEVCAADSAACDGTLDAGGTCNFGVRLSSAVNADGSFASTATVSASGQGDAARPLTGSASGLSPALSVGSGAFTVAGIADGSASGACTDFPVVNLGRNAGLTNAHVDSIAPAGTFATCAPSANACSAAAIPGQGSCNLGLRLTNVTASGTYTGTVSVSADGASAQTRTLTASVTGTYAPVASIGSGTLTVAGIADGSANGACTSLMLTNTGNAPGLGGAAVSFSGGNAANFAACIPGSGTACSGTALAAGASCVLGARLNGVTGNGTLSSTLTVSASGAANASRPVQGSAAGFAVAPTGLVLSQSANSSAIAVSWTAGANLGACTLQNYNGSAWIDIASVNCNAAASSAAYSVSNVGSNWGGRQLRLAVGGSAVATFPQTLACSARAGSASATPTIDEDCNGVWDNYVAGGSSQQAGCDAGYQCASYGWGGPPGNYAPFSWVAISQCITNSYYSDFYGRSCGSSAYYLCSDGYNDCHCVDASGCTHTVTTSSLYY